MFVAALFALTFGLQSFVTATPAIIPPGSPDGLYVFALNGTITSFVPHGVIPSPPRAELPIIAAVGTRAIKKRGANCYSATFTASDKDTCVDALATYFGTGTSWTDAHIGYTYGMYPFHEGIS